MGGSYSKNGERKIPWRILERQYGGRRLAGRPRSRWEDMVQRDATNLLRVRNWRETARIMKEWRERIGRKTGRRAIDE